MAEGDDENHETSEGLNPAPAQITLANTSNSQHDPSYSFYEDFEQIKGLRNAVQLTRGKISELQRNLDLRNNEVELQMSLRQFAENKLAALQELNTSHDMRFNDCKSAKDVNAAHSSVKKPPVKPPRRKHSISVNQDLKDETQTNISSSSSLIDASDAKLFHSLDGSYPSSHSQLSTAASLPNVKILPQNTATQFIPQAELLHSFSSSDSANNSILRKENKKYHRRPRRTSSNISQGTSKAQSRSKSTNIIPLVTPPPFYFTPQWPVALYPVPIGDGTPISSSSRHFTQSQSSLSYPVMLPSDAQMTSSSNNLCQPLSLSLNNNNPQDPARQVSSGKNFFEKRHRRSNSDPIKFDVNTTESSKQQIPMNINADLSKDSSLLKGQHYRSNSKFSPHSTVNLNKHSSKFAALLEEIYTAQKERDEAMLKRMENVYKDRDSRIAFFNNDLKSNQKISDWEDSRIDNTELISDRINGNLEILENAQSPSQIRKHAKQLLQEVKNAKKSSKRDLQKYIRVLKEERDLAVEKNKKLEDELDHYQTALDTSLDDSALSKQNSGEDVQEEETEMLRLCYSLHKSVIQDQNTQNISHISKSEAQSICDTSQNHEAEMELDLSLLKKQLKAEKEARETAEKKCEKLEMAVNVLRKKVNKMNGFDGFEQRLSTSVDYF